MALVAGLILAAPVIGATPDTPPGPDAPPQSLRPDLPPGTSSRPAPSRSKPSVRSSQAPARTFRRVVPQQRAPGPSGGSSSSKPAPPKLNIIPPRQEAGPASELKRSRRVADRLNEQGSLPTSDGGSSSLMLSILLVAAGLLAVGIVIAIGRRGLRDRLPLPGADPDLISVSVAPDAPSVEPRPVVSAQAHPTD